MKITIDNIQQLLEERKQTYRFANNAIQTYNQENELSKEYNGRQILELIQNADDERANRIEISINTNEHLLSIYNDGNPFSYEGIKSILIANSSSKVSSGYIGNKGLGFRSLLYWADGIDILTESFKFSFSRELAMQIAQNDCNLNIDEIRKEQHLSKTCCPFPMLAIPDFTMTDNEIGEKGCKVVIKYKAQFEQDIIVQLKLIDEKTLLFLKNVRTIRIDSNDKNENPHHISKTLNVSFEGEDNYRADDIIWHKIAKEAILPQKFQDPNKEEQKRYSIQLAIPLDRTLAKESYYLYNYLPTQEKVGLPYIIHASLELDSSRNHINNDDVNRYILNEAARLISNIIDKNLKEDTDCSWELFEMMTPREQRSSNSSILETSFFEPLRNLRDSKKIFPTVINAYVGINDYFFENKSDSKYWDSFPIKQGAISLILKPFENDLKIEIRKIPESEFVSALNGISINSCLSITNRAHLINYLIRNKQILQREKPNLFINDNNELIDATNATIFTPKSQEADYPCPEFVNIKFVSRDLYNQLLTMMKADGFLKNDEPSKNSDHRLFSSLFKDKGMSDISDYDKSAVLKAIVSQTNNHINALEKLEDKVLSIKKMFSCLATIYFSNGFETNLENVKLLDSNNNIEDASNLLLDSEENKYIFGNSVSYILSVDKWDIETEIVDNKEYIKFLKLLGINKLIKKDRAGDVWWYANWLESSHVFVGGTNSPYTKDNMNRAMQNMSFIQMSDLLYNNIKDLSLAKIIYLIANNDELISIAHSKENLCFKYTRNYYLETEYSYIRYQFLKLPKVKNKILSSDIVLEDIESDKSVQNINGDRKNIALTFITTNLRGSNEQEIANILNDLSSESFCDTTKKQIRRIYKLIIDTLNKDKRTLKNQELKLCAYSSDTKTCFLPVSQIYYTDNTSIPKALEENIGRSRLYYPSRQGADKICEALGIEPLCGFYPQIITGSISEHQLNKEFGNLIAEIKPYILLYCTQNTDSQIVKKDLASKLKTMRINLVTSCKYTIGDNKVSNLNPLEFIQSNNTFFINAVNISTLSEMQCNVGYCKLISEILSIETHLSGKEDVFIRLFQNPAFMKESAIYEFPDDVEDAKSLMGISQIENNFWCALLGIDSIDNIEETYQQIRAIYSIPNEFQFDMVDYERWLSKESIDLLNYIDNNGQGLPQGVDLSFLHKKVFEDVKNNWWVSFVHCIWERLNKETESQIYFIKYQQEYNEEVIFTGVNNKLYSEDDYTQELKRIILEKFKIELIQSNIKHNCLYASDILGELNIEEQSLFYFDGNQEKVHEIRAKFQKQVEEELSDIENNVDNKVKGTISFISTESINKGKKPISNAISKPGKSHVHTSESERKKKKAGKEAERHVRDLFKSQGIEYRWCSGFSDEESAKDDTLGYDFIYKVNGKDEWRFLEVKRFNGESFILSKHELEIAKKEDFEDRYDVALVYNDDVYIIPRFFKSDTYLIDPESYSVYCKLTNAN